VVIRESSAFTVILISPVPCVGDGGKDCVYGAAKDGLIEAGPAVVVDPAPAELVEMAIKDVPGGEGTSDKGGLKGIPILLHSKLIADKIKSAIRCTWRSRIFSTICVVPHILVSNGMSSHA
jgi:hypothetical protein